MYGDYVKKHLDLQALLKNKDIDAILVSNPSNIFYYSNFTGTNAKLLMFEDFKYLITDFRYQEQAKALNTNFEVLITDENTDLCDLINKLKKKHKFYSLGLEGNFIVRNDWLNYERRLSARLIDVNIDEIRECKSSDEVLIIKEAIAIAEKAFMDTLDYIKVGMSERQVGLFLENKMKEYGASDTSFTTIVASGVRSALPHGVASDKIINDKELVTFDFGCKYKGYCSDITRTIAMGDVDSKLIEIYEIVKEANQLGLDTVRANMNGFDVDKVIRDFIASKGYGDNFGHGLGHSIGIDIHEDPRLRFDVDHKLRLGNIVTIEPGIYIENLGGVRIEDDVLLTEDGIEVLTSLSKELIII